MARATRQEWAERVCRWQSSGLTAQAFAEEAGLNAATLSYWKYQLRRERRAGKSAASKHRTSLAKSARPTFVEATAAANASAIASLELIVRDDITVRVPIGFDEDTLARVLRIARTAR
jgi:hypothetical protein